MATSPRNQIPLKYNFLGPDQKVTQQWAFFLQTLDQNLPPAEGGAGFVIDGTKAATGATTIAQGPAIQRGSMPADNTIYFAPDTGAIYTVNNGSWQLQTPALSGDVIKPAFSNVTSLAEVNPTPGTFGSGSQIPVITTDSKGRVTGISMTGVIAPALNVPGKIGDIVYKSDAAGNIASAADLQYDPVTGFVHIDKEITFTDAKPTFNNLSPLTQVGEVIGFDGTDNVAVAPGTAGYVLTADPVSTTGVSWKPAGAAQLAIEVPFSYGDASPKILAQVPQDKVVLSSSMVILEAFDGVLSELSVGSLAQPDDIMSTTDNVAQIAATWSNTPNTVYSAPTDIYLTINNGSGATQGRGIIVINIQI